MQEKQKVRKQLLTQRNTLSAATKKAYDDQICAYLIKFVEERNYKSIHSYLPMGSEVDIRPFLTYCLQNDKRVFASKTLRNRVLEHYELISLDQVGFGLYGTPYPVAKEVYIGSYDLILVPGLGFDCHHYRLGYGGGYYDSFLADHKNAYQLGIAYPFQILSDLPKESHDARLDEVLVGSNNL